MALQHTSTLPDLIYSSLRLNPLAVTLSPCLERARVATADPPLAVGAAIGTAGVALLPVFSFDTSRTN